MKALKEKRISLRSLWRMGLVVLSVFALAFAACGDSGGGDDNGTPGQVGPASSIVPNYLEVKVKPIASGEVYEGQLVDLQGLVLNVRYSDNTIKEMSDSTKVTVTPSIYDSRISSYVLSYTENNKTLTTSLTGLNVLRLLDLDVTGQMNKQSYKIDEMVDFAGLTVNGVYSRNPAANASARTYPGDLPADWSQMADYFRKPIPLTSTNPDYKWAWVWNSDVQGNPGSFINDQPGVLVSIGAYGNINSNIIGEGPNTTYRLTGKRIELAQLYQVRSLAWNPEPSYSKTIFYDDPSLISGVKTSALYPTMAEALKDRREKWLDHAFSDARLDVTYDDGQTVNYGLRDLLTMGETYLVNTLMNTGRGGTWASLEFYPISRAGITIDVEKDTKLVVTGTEGANGVQIVGYNEKVEGFSPYNYNDKVFYRDSPDSGGVYIAGDGGWAQWAQQGMGYTRMEFTWRGVPVRTVVPVYNRPSSMAVEVKSEYPNPPLAMNGYDAVYRRPEGMADFFAKLRVSVTYIRQGGSDTDTKTRTDIVADQAAGTCRSTLMFEDTNNSLGNYPVMAADGAWTMQTLYSEGIWNWRDTAGDFAQAFIRAQRDSSDAVTQTTYDNVGAQSQLTKTNVDNFANRARTIAARIYYVGHAGDPSNTRSVNNRAIVVAPNGPGYQDYVAGTVSSLPR